MKIEEEFLTIAQARELKKLGVSFNSANFGIYNFYESLAEDEVNEIRKLDKVLRSKLVTETLSVAEMFEMLPNYIYIDNETESYSLAYNGSLISYATVDCYGYWLNRVAIMRGSFTSDKDNIYLKEWNLRDALFEMIKWLKVNKLI